MKGWQAKMAAARETSLLILSLVNKSVLKGPSSSNYKMVTQSEIPFPLPLFSMTKQKIPERNSLIHHFMPRILNPLDYFPVSLYMNMYRRWFSSCSRTSFNVTIMKKKKKTQPRRTYKPGAWHTCHCRYSGGWDGRITWARSCFIGSLVWFDVFASFLFGGTGIESRPSCTLSKHYIQSFFSPFELAMPSRFSYFCLSNAGIAGMSHHSCPCLN